MGFRRNGFAALAGLIAVLLLAGCAGRAPGTGAGTSQYKVGKPYRIDGAWYYPAVDYDYVETGIASWYGPGFHGKTTANGEAYDMNALTAAHRTLPMPSMVRVTNLENGRQIELRVNDRGPYARGRIIDVSRRAAQLLGFEKAGTAKVRVEIMPAESRQLALKAGAPAESIPRAPAVATAAPAPALAAPTTPLEAQPLPPPPGARAAMPGPSMTRPAPAAAPPRALAQAPQADGKVSVLPVRKTAMFIQAGAFVSLANASRLRAELSSFGPSNIVPAVVGNQQFYRVRLGPIATLADADRMLDNVVGAGHPEARLIVD